MRRNVGGRGVRGGRGSDQSRSGFFLSLKSKIIRKWDEMSHFVRVVDENSCKIRVQIGKIRLKGQSKMRSFFQNFDHNRIGFRILPIFIKLCQIFFIFLFSYYSPSFEIWKNSILGEIELIHRLWSKMEYKISYKCSGCSSKMFFVFLGVGKF